MRANIQACWKFDTRYFFGGHADFAQVVDYRLAAFIATLSFSRLKYVEFSYRQDQRSFIAAHIRLFEFLDGVPKRAVIDNLKAGVITPDLYDPKLNRAYQEIADHYGFFIDAARVRHPHIGKTVWVRGAEKLVAIFYQHQLIRQYPRNRQTRLFDSTGFPKNVQVLLGEQAIQNLLERAQAIGPNFKELILSVLTPHAKLNYRRALALLNFRAKYSAALLEAAAPTAVAKKIYVPQQFQRLLEKLQAPDDDIPISGATQELLRPADYFIHSPNPKETVCNPIPN